jgi:hypothetical protein
MKRLLVLVSCLGLATAANAGVIALYEFEGNFSDSSGSATTYDGTPVGSPGLIVDGERGNVLSVSPGNQVDCGVVTNSSVMDMTVGLWVLTPDPIGVSNRPLTSASADYTTDPGWILFMRNDAGWLGPNNVWFRINGEPAEGASWEGGDLWIHGDDPDIGPPIFTAGEWIHLAITFDATSRMIKGYVNGLFAAERLVTEDTRAVGSDVESLILGGQQEAFTGLLDDVFIADHAMTLGEIQAISGIPEPATIALLGLGGLALLRLRKKR